MMVMYLICRLSESMSIATFRVCAITLSAMAGVGCSNSEVQAKFSAQDEFAGRLVVTHRQTGYLPMVPTADSVVICFAVDSLMSDSVFGTAQAPHFESVAIPGLGPDVRWAGETRHDSITLRINPDILDVGVLFEGTRRGAAVSGEWITEAFPRTTGTFELALQAPCTFKGHL
jgi:hypothetical protein